MISFDAKSNKKGTGTTENNWNHTVGSLKPRRLLAVCIAIGNHSSSNPSYVSSADFGGQNLTFGTRIPITPNAQFYNAEIWYLLNPTPGTANVRVTTTTSETTLFTEAASFYGVKQILQPDSTNTAFQVLPFGDVGGSSASMDPIHNGCLIIDSFCGQELITPSANSPATQLDVQVGSSGDVISHGASYQIKADSNASIFSWSWSGTGNWSEAFLAFLPDIQGGAGVNAL